MGNNCYIKIGEVPPLTVMEKQAKPVKTFPPPQFSAFLELQSFPGRWLQAKGSQGSGWCSDISPLRAASCHGGNQQWPGWLYWGTDMLTWCCTRTNNPDLSKHLCWVWDPDLAHSVLLYTEWRYCTQGDGDISAWRSWGKIFNHALGWAFCLTVALDCPFWCHVHSNPAGFLCSSATGPGAELPTLLQGQGEDREGKVPCINSS